jgi:competence protein ComFC
MLNPARNSKAQGENKISNRIKEVLNHLLNIVYPKTCLVCHKPLENNAIDNLLCFNCWQGIKKNRPPFCVICGRQIRGVRVSERVCPNCQGKNFSFDRTLSPCIYEGVIRELIHKFKYQSKDYLSSLLTRLLIEFICQYQINLELFDLIIPIPLHKIRLREREFNQAELIARKVTEEFPLPLSASNLWRKHHRQAQMELEEMSERWKNIKGCFALRNPAEVKGKNIILIDDVLTTGATCSEAASVLKAAGAGSIWVLTLAN